MHQKLQDFTRDDTFFVIDFDQTVTTGNSASSFSLFRKSGVMWEVYDIENQGLYEYFHPFELDHTLTQQERWKLMYDWHYWAFEVLKKYDFSKEQFLHILSFLHLMSIRQWFRDFFYKAHLKNIPIIIFSAWIQQTIEKFFEENNILYPNVHIQANTMFFDDTEKFIWIDETNFIYPTEKIWSRIWEEIRLWLESRNNCILVGDMVDDITMAPNGEHIVFKLGIVNSKNRASQMTYETFFDELIIWDEAEVLKLQEILELL